MVSGKTFIIPKRNCFKKGSEQENLNDPTFLPKFYFIDSIMYHKTAQLLI